MRDTLYLRLRDPSPDAPTAYAVVATDVADPDAPRPGLQVQTLPLASVLSMAANRRVVVFVPSADIRLTRVNVPVRQPAKVLQAAPFVLEDQFADDVEQLHFAVGPRQPDDSHPIAAVDRGLLDAWLAPFRERGVRIAALVPETLALPWRGDGVWSVLPEAGQMTVRSAAFGGFGCDEADFELLLGLAENGTPAALRVLVARNDDRDYTRLGRSLDLLPGFEQPLECLIRHWRPAQSIDLLQGAYSQKQDFDRYWQPWKRAAMLAGFALLAYGGQTVADALRLQREVAELDAANEATFRRLFPSETRIIDLGAQVEQQLTLIHGGGTGGALFELMQTASAGLTENPGLSLRNAQFRENALYLDLDGTDLQVLERLREWFESRNDARLDVESADANEGGVQIRLKLTRVRA